MKAPSIYTLKMDSADGESLYSNVDLLAATQRLCPVLASTLARAQT